MGSMKTVLRVEIHLQHPPNGLHSISIKVLDLKCCIHSDRLGSACPGSSTSEMRAPVPRSSNRRGATYDDPISLEVKGPLVPTRLCGQVFVVRLKGTSGHGGGARRCLEAFHPSECPGDDFFNRT